MASFRMEIGGVWYNDAGNGTVTLRLYPQVMASPTNVPAGVDPSHFRPQPGNPVDIVVPGQKLPDVVLKAIEDKQDLTAPGGVAYYVYTLVNGNWVNPTRCNPDGTVPYTGG